jgi:hypothetical protein
VSSAPPAPSSPPVIAERAAESVSPPPVQRPEGPRTPPPRNRDVNRVSRSSPPAPVQSAAPDMRGDPRQRSPIVPLPHGVIYYTDKGLAERVIILQERTAATTNGELSVRFVMTSRKGKKTLEIRCDFYDEQGAPAGTVESVELPIREGVPATIALASRKPAARYILFVRD